MGGWKWFSRTFVPEKELLGIDWAMGDPGEQARRAATKANEAAAPIVEPPAVTAPAITSDEAETLSAKRLARLGRYFTSPLGVLSGASTGSQKIFS